MTTAGLSTAEVEQRIADGRSNGGGELESRSVFEILKANTLNSVTIVLLVLGLALLAMGRG
ncbi:MAG: hypothetical protein GY926_10860, partial [bacterium]|nr:hypothetical protein [bacterium]